MEPYELCACQAGRLLGRGDLSARELLDSVLDRAASVGAGLGAFVHLDADGARARARRQDARRAAGASCGPLHGVPFSVKDLIAVAGMPLRAGSEGTPPTPVERDAWCVGRLRAAGLIPFAMTRTDEFACGITTVGARNPHDAGRIAGGSSGGSAVAVSAGAGPLALGTDTGGSVRNPALLCGVLGLKPTLGRIGRTGVVPLSSTLDTVGVLARCLEDLALVLPLLEGRDPGDPSSASGIPPDRHVPGLEAGRARIGVVERRGWVQPIADAAWDAYLDAVGRLRDRGASLRTVDLPMMPEAPAIMMGVLGPEFASSQADVPPAQQERYGAAVRATIRTGRTLPAAAYTRALRLRRRLREGWRSAFAGLDALALPGVPRGATAIGQEAVRWGDGHEESVDAAFSRYVCGPSLAGLPVLAVPHGTDGDGMPLGVQLVGRPFAEHAVLELARGLRSGPLSITR